MKKIFVAILMTIVVMSMCVFTVQAAASVKVQMALDKTTVKAGDTVTLTISTSDFVDVSGDGIFAISGKFVFDKDTFETLTANDIKTVNGWGTPQLSSDASQIIVDRNNFTNQPGEVMEVTLHVKSTAATNKNVEIRMNNVAITYDGGATSPDITVGDVVSTIAVEGTSVDPDPVQPDNPLDNTTGGNNNNNNNNNQGDNSGAFGNNVPSLNNIGGSTTNPISGNNTQTPGTNGNGSNSAGNGKQVSSLPKTGTNGIIAPMIILLAVSGMIAYIKYRKMDV